MASETAVVAGGGRGGGSGNGNDSVRSVTAEELVSAQESAAAASSLATTTEQQLTELKRSLAAGSNGSADGSAAAAASGTALPSSIEDLKALLAELKQEESVALQALQSSPHVEEFVAILKKQQSLDAELTSLTQQLKKEEADVEALLARLARSATAPKGKDTFLQQYAVAREARQRKYALLQELQARHESQLVLLHMQQQRALGALRTSAAAEHQREEEARREAQAVQAAVAKAEESLTSFRAEFEHLRVALTMDRRAKNAELAQLEEQRQALEATLEAHHTELEAAKAEAVQEVEKTWKAQLEAEKQSGEAKYQAELTAIEAKMGQVKAAVSERYETGFQPLLAEIEEKHLQELQKVVELQQQLAAKEAELKAAHAAARQSAERVEAASSLDSAGDAEEALAPEEVAEFHRVRESVSSLWQQADVPAQDVVEFLCELDEAAPFSMAALQLYTQHAKQLGVVQ